jgi:hypothetical protein
MAQATKQAEFSKKKKAHTLSTREKLNNLKTHTHKQTKKKQKNKSCMENEK